ncbi:MAG TPA: tripartite tricarboxylate transporter substrate-binding protein, partial [Burkholderiales bacterium]|nr:tripartite tricarboxylate transporter substrate-binding protein [Burkholderiales bacterium]
MCPRSWNNNWHRNIQRVAVAVAIAIPAAAAGQASAQVPYPNKPIRLVVPYPAGTASDFAAREIGQQFTKALGQPVLIDPRPGAAATLGHALVAKSTPDGYTLLFATTGGLVSGPALVGAKVGYDALKDFAPIGLVNYVPYGLVVTASLPAHNVNELIDLAKAS